MTTSVYLCSCELEHTSQHSIGEAPDTQECPACGGTARRVLRWNGGAILRGRGWAKHADRDNANFKKGPQ